jgi:hypothetical protein
MISAEAAFEDERHRRHRSACSPMLCRLLRVRGRPILIENHSFEYEEDHIRKGTGQPASRGASI